MDREIEEIRPRPFELTALLRKSKKRTQIFEIIQPNKEHTASLCKQEDEVKAEKGANIAEKICRLCAGKIMKFKLKEDIRRIKGL